MIYIVIFEPCYFKVGACAEIYGRLTQGYWMNVHPPMLCGRLDNFRLYKLFRGDLDCERAVHTILCPAVGEFYELERLWLVVHILEFFLEPMVTPVLNMPMPLRRQRRVCCGAFYNGYGSAYACTRAFATAGRKQACPYCHKMISIRRDKQREHQQRCVAFRDMRG